MKKHFKIANHQFQKMQNIAKHTVEWDWPIFHCQNIRKQLMHTQR